MSYCAIDDRTNVRAVLEEKSSYYDFVIGLLRATSLSLSVQPLNYLIQCCCFMQLLSVHSMFQVKMTNSVHPVLMAIPMAMHLSCHI